MGICTVALAMLLGVIVQIKAESCAEDTDCTGYNIYNGVRCVSQVCQCNEDYACQDYDPGQTCSYVEQCDGYPVYPGIECKRRCSCNSEYGCTDIGGCSPTLKVSGLGPSVAQVCIFDHYTELLAFTATLASSGDACSGTTWTVSSTKWTGYKIFKEEDFEILEENTIGEETRNDATYESAGLKHHGVFAVQVEVTYHSNSGAFGTSELTGYFAKSCAKSYEETQDQRYQTSEPICQFTSAQISGLGYQYSYELTCPSSCSGLQNPQTELVLTINIGCSSEIGVVHLVVRNCPKNDTSVCRPNEDIKDISTDNSVKYKPRQVDLSWNYHGLFVTVYLTNDLSLEGNVIVKYGPVPEAGACSIVPESGYALTTQYNITCSGFTVEDDLELKYTMLTHYEEAYDKASKMYTGLSPNRFNMLLQPGKELSDYIIYIWVKAFVYYGAFVTVLSQTQVYPPSQAGDVNILDLAESFIAVDSGKDSSVIEELISVGNTEGATQLLGAITASLNLEVENETVSDTDAAKRKDVRTAIVTVLTEIPVNDFETVSSTLSVLNEATEIREEISEVAQDVATELYSNLADGFDQFIAQQSTAEVVDTAGSILDGVTRILDINTDTGVAEMNKTDGTKDVEKTKQITGKIEKARNSAVKLLKTIDTVSNTMMQRQQSGASATVFMTDTMTVGIQKLANYQLSELNYSATGASESRGSFQFPDIAQKLSSGQDYGLKILYIDKNPYVWDSSARDVTSPVISISLKNTDNTPAVLNELDDPISISLSNFGSEESSINIFQVTLKKHGENHTDADFGNITFDTSGTNMLSFNISAIPGRTVSLTIVPVTNISSFRMFIKTDGKPTFDEIIQEGFLYPEKIPYSEFAYFKFSQNSYLPPSLEDRQRIYLTSNSSLSRSSFSGTYYIGLALDLNHSATLETLWQDYPACLRSNVSDCKETINVTIDIQTKQLGCLYWDESIETWSSQGCEVSPFTTKDTIECLCTHLTSFSGSILVLPNFVDPIGDIQLFLTFFDNPVVVTAVIIVWVIYFFLIHWARQADKKDQEKVGVINCTDNSPTNTYLYLVCVVTGWWKDAGTSANVFIFLKGSKGTSSNHCLSSTARPCFQTGSEDWFLVTTEQSLGELQAVTFWHDNIGAKPHWYLNHVYIKDIQLKRSWHFIYNDWLAVDRGSLLRTSATLEAVTEEELKFKQKHNFMVKSTQDLRDSHLWLSIFSKPAKSSFTRVQRLTCALSLLLTTMLTNIMFYGIPTDDPADQVGMAGSISLSLSAIVIGIESSLIMFPVNLLVLQLFLKVKPKPKRLKAKVSSKSYAYLQKAYEVCSRITDRVVFEMVQRFNKPVGETDEVSEDEDERETEDSSSMGSYGEGSFITAPTKPSEVNLESVPEESPSFGPKSSKILPWWFLYIAWFLVVAVSIISSYFVMLYGLKYGYNKSVSWLVSFLTGFTQSAFVTQPLKVICVAVIITLIFKKPADYEDFGPDIELDEDELYLHEVSGAEEIHHPTIEPLSKNLMAKIRQRLHLEWLMDMTIRDIVLYVIYMAVVMFMVHGHRNINLAYRNNVAIEDVLVNPGCIKLYKCFFLAKADTVERMFQYFEDVLIPSLADMSIADHNYATPGSSHFLLGPFRLRQLRIQKGTCLRTKSSIFKRFGHDLPECVGSYWLGDEDTGSYNNSWKIPLSQSTEDGPWSYQSTWKLKTIPYSGIHATYSGGGFVLEMPSESDLITHLNDMKNTDWIDDRTRAIFAEFTLYNPNADLFSVVMIFFELTDVGGVFPNHQIFTTKLYHYSSNLGPYLALCEVLFLCFNIAFTYIEVKKYRKVGKREYFEDLWSYVEIVQLALAYTVIGLFFQRLVSVSSIIEQYRESKGQTFVSFYTAIAWDFVLGYVMAFQVALITLKFIKLLRFNRRIFMIADTVTFAKSNLISFAFMFIVFMIAFGHFTCLAFGSILYGYKSFGSSLFTMLNFALGASDLPSMYTANRILGPIYFAVFVFFSQWCFLTIFVAILNFGINDSKAKSEERRNRFELIDYVVGKIKAII